jgi:cell division septal protein FtsQ
MNYPPRRPRKTNSNTRFDVALRQRRATTVNGPRLSSRLRFVLAFVVVLAGASAAGLSWFWSDAWRVSAITVRNSTSVPMDRVMAASGIQGEHTQFVDLAAAAQRINELPGIEAAKIACSWDGACEIAIKETSAIAVWQSGAGQVWVDGERKVQQLADKAPAQSALVVRVESGSLPSTEKLMDARVARALTELSSVQPDVKQYVYSPEFGLSFTRFGHTVRLGVSEYAGAMRDKLDALSKLETWLTAKNIQARVLDVRFPEASFYMK